jgi:homogentisate 1,2-dioxygenase
MYSHVNASMDTQQHHICNADGDFLIVPQKGSLVVHTELGRIGVMPTEICIVPRGIIFQVVLPETYPNL